MHTDKLELVNSQAAGLALLVAGRKSTHGWRYGERLRSFLGGERLHRPSVSTGCHRCLSRFLPAAGYRNGTSTNNQGSNGNYWSSSINTGNTSNAQNLNFNSGNVNMNNNNRKNGFSVRAVKSTYLFSSLCILSNDRLAMCYRISFEELLSDLHVAYVDARRHKRQKSYQLSFERRAEENLRVLACELWERRYTPQPSSCFIITDPKQREVFAAQFRDRIVHHLYYNYTHEMLERTFITDSYSCIPRRGTHYGIGRLERHIRRESQNYTEPCWVLKMDIRGYFMHIDRLRLLGITMRQLERMACHRVKDREPGLWGQKVDLDMVEYLSRKIILQNPVESCRRCGSLDEWEGLPPSKSLFCSSEGRGLPIGNLTSQLFSNVYLNELDQYVKRVLKVKHYGRYVDDFYIVSADRKWLLGLRQPVSDFLQEHLGLEVNEDKTVICDVRQGVEFLGAFLKPRRRYVSNATLRRMERKVPTLSDEPAPERLLSRLNSMLGLLSHYRSYRIRRHVFYELPFVYRYGHYLRGMEKFVLT